MQELFVVGSSVAILAGISFAIMRRPSLGWQGGVPSRAMLGLVAGLLGALIVVIPRTDLVPDNIEPDLWLIVIVGVSALILVILYRRA
jgi:tetrahydromethanopterin S-methyltransferase subunit C